MCSSDLSVNFYSGKKVLVTGGLGFIGSNLARQLVELAQLDPQPDSVPINALVAVEGTPLAGRKFVDTIEFVRTIAVARILMPKAMVRLSAGLRAFPPAPAFGHLADDERIAIHEILTATLPDLPAGWGK